MAYGEKVHISDQATGSRQRALSNWDFRPTAEAPRAQRVFRERLGVLGASAVDAKPGNGQVLLFPACCPPPDAGFVHIVSTRAIEQTALRIDCATGRRQVEEMMDPEILDPVDYARLAGVCPVDSVLILNSTKL
jgi:hypothetical protein